MNLPNKLTVIRLAMVPVFLISFIISQRVSFLAVPAMVICLICYAVAELTDLMDGKIARKRGLVTDLGKVMDPFADTLSHVTYFLCFLSYGIMPLWAFVIIMWREYGILFVRMLLAKYAGKSMPANIFGKSKTVLYAVTTIVSIVFICLMTFLPGAAEATWVDGYYIALYILYALSAFASLMSFVIYIKDVFKSKALSGMTR
ncbi:MAG: CDP-diacylglycerol--glycerol-3-phosphate 3-phosphatidyltransferase [Spirochaetales bacterium]|nr:CDP-diacylglycerol--glycerol-3-phosphate 3-phosphatidyltransferase [Spirochaetales bacterium]